MKKAEKLAEPHICNIAKIKKIILILMLLTFFMYIPSYAGAIQEEEYAQTEAYINYIYYNDPYQNLRQTASDPTEENIIAEISFNKKGVKILNNDGNTRREFSENGEFTFEYQDDRGNNGQATAQVTWIKEPVDITTIYDVKQETEKHI